jgi:hypothetical protein
MELTAREVAFVKSEMKKIERDDARRPTEKREADRIRQKAESVLTE